MASRAEFSATASKTAKCVNAHGMWPFVSLICVDDSAKMCVFNVMWRDVA